MIGFGVGNTTHAATLHPSVRRVEVADLSRGILAHAGYFKDANARRAARSARRVYVNDGRQHLQMQPAASYDLITLEPPPIAYAGVAALYSREFYALARSRLKPNGYISQWLPAYQVPTATTLAMIRAFVDVFPQAVLLSGAEAGSAAARRQRLAHRDRPGAAGRRRSRGRRHVQADLQRVDLGSVREIVGTFVGSARTLARRDARPVAGHRRSPAAGVRRPVAAQLRPMRCRRPSSISGASPNGVPAMFRRTESGSVGRRARHVSGASRTGLRRFADEVAEARRGAEREGRPLPAATTSG